MVDNGLNSQFDGCIVCIDSVGNVYVFGIVRWLGMFYEIMYKFVDGGVYWIGSIWIAAVVSFGVFDLVVGWPVMDGIVGVRVDLVGGLNVDIVNGVFSGIDVIDCIVLIWVDGMDGFNNEKLMFASSINGG